MIKFFRHIRQKMITQNKAMKYIIYAIGEIVLVVIGILIALQINNNNESEKAREFELKMLHEVRKELIQDTIYFNMITMRAKRALEGSNGLMLLIANNNHNSDSIRKYMSKMVTRFQYIYHKGAYEAIKSTGIDKISNDTIRQLLTDMYDFSLPRADLLIKNGEEHLSGDIWDNYSLMADMNIVTNDEGKPRLDLKPKSTALKNPETLKLIAKISGHNNNAVYRLNNLVDTIKYMLTIIDRELEIKNVLEGIPINNWNSP